MTFTEGLIQVFDKIARQAGVVIDWTSSNILPYIEELAGKAINYEFLTSCAWLLLGVLFLVLGIVFISRVYKKGNEMDIDTEELYVFGGFIMIIIFVILAIFQIPDLIECIAFPEKTLFEMIRLYL